MASIFTRIVLGEIPAIKIYEDDATLAFMDISPASRGHTLVITKAEHADLIGMPAELVAQVARTVQHVAQAIHTALAPDGINIIQNNGAAAGQTVFHYHVHIIPRWEGDAVLKLWAPQTVASVELQEIADRIRAGLR
ncbi:MAG TPA: HIT family protein [Roseiflexaceae bacterium]|nr:HIT family protein [Roseiflexaceae bacterium]HMP40658.1 HIT family protein [Roseiflexaceae bacterium]